MRYDVSGLVRYERDDVVCLHLVAFYVFASPPSLDLLLILFLLILPLLLCFLFLQASEHTCFSRFIYHQPLACSPNMELGPGKGTERVEYSHAQHGGYLMTI